MIDSATMTQIGGALYASDSKIWRGVTVPDFDAAATATSALSSGVFALVGVIAGALIAGILTVVNDSLKWRREFRQEAREHIAQATADLIANCHVLHLARMNVKRERWSAAVLSDAQQASVTAEGKARQALAALSLWVDSDTRQSATALIDSSGSDEMPSREATFLSLAVKQAERPRR